MYPPGEKSFLAINFITIVALFILILAGGIVRTTGSGMGCPDWPKCFGRYIPPTSQRQLPGGYKDKYVEQRVAKNERFAKTLDMLGYGELASGIRYDKSVLQAEEFNVFKTWTEYINRLIGALSGLFLLGCMLLSITYLKNRKRIFFLSLFNLVLVFFQAWLGSVVVSTNLLAWIVTVHMLVAIAIIGISIYTYFEARVLRDRNLLSNRNAGPLKIIAFVVLVLTVVQIALGTEVREHIDAISATMDNLNRPVWVSKVGANFNWHRDLAILVLTGNAILFFLIRGRYILTGFQVRFITYVLIIIGLQITTGIILAYLGLPAMVQAAHLVISTLLFGAQFYLVLLLKTNKIYSR